MASPTRNTGVQFPPEPLVAKDDHGRRGPPRSPPVIMNSPSRSSHFDALVDAWLGSDDDELPALDTAHGYLHADFLLLFDTHGGTLPECSSAWLPCLPPLARQLHDMTLACLPPDEMQDRAAELIRQGMQVTVTDASYGRSVLHWACMLAPPGLVGWLLCHGAAGQLNQIDHQGQSPLACVHAHRRLPGGGEVIAALLSAGAKCDSLPFGGAELLYRKDLPVSAVRKLLRAGVDVDGGGAFEPSPLVAGCGSVNWGAASLLLDAGANVCRRGPFGVSILHNAEIPVWLAEQCHRRGADVNVTDMLGETPLMAACARGKLPLVRWLVSKGARLDAVADDGRSVAEHAALGGAAMTRWLARYGHLVPGAASPERPTS